MSLLSAKMTYLLSHLFTSYPVLKLHLIKPFLATSSENFAINNIAWHHLHFPDVLYNARGHGGGIVKGKVNNLKSE